MCGCLLDLRTFAQFTWIFPTFLPFTNFFQLILFWHLFWHLFSISAFPARRIWLHSKEFGVPSVPSHLFSLKCLALGGENWGILYFISGIQKEFSKKKEFVAQQQQQKEFGHMQHKGFYYFLALWTRGFLKAGPWRGEGRGGVGWSSGWGFPSVLGTKRQKFIWNPRIDPPNEGPPSPLPLDPGGRGTLGGWVRGSFWSQKKSLLWTVVSKRWATKVSGEQFLNSC